MKPELRTRARIAQNEHHRVEDAGDLVKWPDSDLGVALREIFPPVDIPGAIRKLRTRELYLLAIGPAKKPMGNLPLQPPAPLAVLPIAVKGSGAPRGSALQSDSDVYVPTKQEEDELNRRFDNLERNPPPYDCGPAPDREGGTKQSSPKRTVSVPTGKERILAAQENAQPDDGLNGARFSAREKVVRDFYEGRPGLGQGRASQDMGCHPVTHVANQHPAGYGIDLSRPVMVVDIPPPPAVDQYVKSHGNPGNFFDPIGGQSADKLGLNGDSKLRQSKRFTVTETFPKQQALISRNGPVVDSWTDGANPVATKGTGTQMTVDNTTKACFTPQPQSW